MAAPLIKIIVLGLSVLWGWRGGKRADKDADPEPEESVDAAQSLSRTLDLLFSFALCGFVAVQFGALRIKPLESRGYDAFGELFVALLLLGVKAIIFVIVPAMLLYALLRSFEGLAPRLIVYGFLAVVGAAGWHFAGQREAAAAAVRAQAAAAKVEEWRQEQREQLRMDEARVIAERKEEAEHERMVARLVELTGEVYERWTQDLHAAKAVGFERDVPPMMSVHDDGIHEKKVTNLSAKKICVKLVRVLRQPDAMEYLRCPQDEVAECRVIARGASLNFNAYPHGNNEACKRGLFEYRVGTPLEPEPSWWSASALSALQLNAATYREQYSAMTTIDLRTEELRLEQILADIGRAERWKRELGR